MKYKGLILFDIDGVIRDVTESYRLAIQKTVYSYIAFSPSLEEIDLLKSEGNWNNDWDLSFEILKRNQNKFDQNFSLPKKNDLIERFNKFYFGGGINEDPSNWKGFINNEKLLVKKQFFKSITDLRIKWGFVSGAEAPSAKFILEERIGLKSPSLIAMGDAPDKPNPTGFLTLISKLSKLKLEEIDKPIGYLGDTVADVLTVQNAKKIYPKINFISYAVAPPHLHCKSKISTRKIYENKLRDYGADYILDKTIDILDLINKW